MILLFQRERVVFDYDLVKNARRRDVQSRFSLYFGECLVETSAAVEPPNAASMVLASNTPSAVKLARLGKHNSLQTTIAEATMTDTDGEILTLDEVAAYLKAGKRTVYRLAQKGEIPAFKLGGTWRFRRSELDLWIAESINKKKQEVS